MSGVIGDIAVSSDGRSLIWESDRGSEFAQRTKSAAAFTRGTYKFNIAEGFPVSVAVFAESLTETAVANLVKYFLLGRPNVAEVYRVRASRAGELGRDWTVTAELSLQDETILEFTI